MLVVVYISCDPATLARAVLCRKGCEIKKVQPVNMFPLTSQVDCVVSLKRKHSS